MNNKLVSIIIPAYNRAHLIVDTLQSIAGQSYEHWECIVVDDGSTDDTIAIVNEHCKKDRRFSWYKRPDTSSKGANACRNYGLEQSKGTLINWFDSDDFMHPEFLSIKVAKIDEGQFDFVISRSVDWHPDDTETPIYDSTNEGKEISSYHFIKQYIHCITNDFMATRESIGTLRFNEKLTSGQEYNFISRYLCTTINGTFFETVLSKRRVHSGSIQSDVNTLKDEYQNKYKKQTLINKYYLLKDIMAIGDVPSKNYLSNSIMALGYDLVKEKQEIPFYEELVPILREIKGVKKMLYYRLALLSEKIVGKGYRILKKAMS